MEQKNVLLIGGGLGGISAAISMAASGYPVKIFEKNSHLGGKLNRREIDGFKFDLGPSILTMPHIFENLFKMHGRKIEDYVQIKRLPLEWRCFFPDKTVIDLYGKPEEFINANSILTDNDLTELRSYLAYAYQMGKTVEEGYFARGLDDLRQVLGHYGFINTWRKFDYFSTMSQAVERHISNPYLQDIFNFFIKYVGSSPYTAPAVLNMLCYIQFLYGLWYVPGGLFELSQGLTGLVSELEIEVHTETEVVKIETDGTKATGVILSNGDRHSGDIIISNMEVIPSYKKLLGDEFLPADYEKKFEPSCSGYVLHLGVNRKYDQLGHHNFFFSRNPQKHFQTIFSDYRLPEDPTIYLVATSRTDPSQAPSGCENIKILPHIPHLGNGGFTRAEYDSFRELVLNKLENMGLDQLREHIIVEDEWLPDDIQKNYYSNQGSIYGVVSDRVKNKGFKAPKQSKRFNNLYFVGGSVNPGGGMPMAVLSGQQVANIITGN